MSLYLLLIIFGLCVAYGVLWFIFPLFFQHPRPRISRHSFYSLIYIVILVVVAFSASFAISNLDWSNRVLHAFGGGFVSFFICFLVARDSKVSLTKFQFFLFSFLVVMSLGIVNEIAEFGLQNYAGFSFAKTANDTWLDLISNAVGASIGALFFVPFIKKYNNKL